MHASSATSFTTFDMNNLKLSYNVMMLQNPVYGKIYIFVQVCLQILFMIFFFHLQPTILFGKPIG
jgi:hypothetical protein